MLNGYADPTVLHMYAKTQPIAITSSHNIAKYIPEKYGH